MYRRCIHFACFVLALSLIAGTATAADPFRQDTGPDGIVSMEAENFDDNVPNPPHEWIFVTEPAGFSGEGAMQNTPADPGGGVGMDTDYVENSPRLDFQVNFVKAGTHYIWLRGYGQDGNSDSCHAGLDGEAQPGGYRFWSFSAAYTWLNVTDGTPARRTLEVPSTGVHTVNVWMREDGCIIDKIVLTTNPDYTPIGVGPEESFRGARVKAYDPGPADGAIYLDTWATLSWMPGETAVSHDVYFGESLDDVNNATNESDIFQGNSPSPYQVVGFPGFAYPDGLVPGTTYYWRVDEVEADATTVHKGDIWSFSIPARKAHNPIPTDGAKYMATDTTLSWTGGLKTKLHYVYFGTDPNAVGSATGALPQTATTYDPGPLEEGVTYYWRVDEFDGAATYTGDVWSFSTISAIPITDPTLVGWWKFEAGSGKTAVDFSGHSNHGTLVDDVEWVPGMFNLALEFLGDDKGHVELPAGMVTTSEGSILMWVNTDQIDDTGMLWYGTETGGDGFGDENEIHLHVAVPGVVGFWIEGGDNDVSLTGPQIAGAGWTHVAATWDLTDGCRLYANGQEVASAAHNNTVADLAVIRLGRPVSTGNGNRYYDGLMDDVRLFDHAITADQVNAIMSQGEDPLRAGGPNPRNGATVSIDEATPLTWSPGENAAEHDVYLGTDSAAVAGADASDTTGIYRGRQAAASFTPADVEWGGGPYYWRIDEIQADGTITTGGVWSFSVLDYILVEDFEGYTDDDTAGEAIWQHWIDGFGVADNGSQVGYLLPPYAERTIVHGGAQSMPLLYDNTAGVKNSEATLTLTAPRDWTQQDVTELSLWFHGLPASVGSFVEGPAGTYTMTASGTDIWGTADEFHYAFKTLTGAGSIAVKVESVELSNVWSKAGVMLRETLDPGSKFAAVYITPTNANGTPTEGCRFQARTDTGIDATSDTSVATAEQMAITAPYWVKLERDVTGNFRGYYSSDGTNWRTLVWRPSMTMGSTIYIGLALTSHDAALTCTAKLSNVQTTGNVSGQWQSQDIGLVSNAAEPLYVALSNAAGSAAVVAHDDPAAATVDDWSQWRIPLQRFADQGINLRNVDKIAIGLGSKSGVASAGGSGTLYLDDLRLYRSASN